MSLDEKLKAFLKEAPDGGEVEFKIIAVSKIDGSTIATLREADGIEAFRDAGRKRAHEQEIKALSPVQVSALGVGFVFMGAYLAPTSRLHKHVSSCF